MKVPLGGSTLASPRVPPIPLRLAVHERIVTASVENIKADLRVPVAHLIKQGCEREAGALEHFFLARRHARHVAR